MSGLGRYIRVLRLFDEARSDWNVSDIAARLDAPVSTVYRLVRELVAGGFLEASLEAHYRLGPLFIEYDRLIRVTDPLYEAGLPLLHEVTIQARIACVAVLARLHGDTVMCVADTSTPGAARSSYERGRPRPLTRGATSKAILAQLPARKLTRLLAEEGARTGQSQDWQKALQAELTGIRRRGYSITRGEVDSGLMGIAAPIRLSERGLIGSISLVLEGSAVDEAAERRLAVLVVSTAALLAEALTPRHASDSDEAAQ